MIRLSPPFPNNTKPVPYFHEAGTADTYIFSDGAGSTTEFHASKSMLAVETITLMSGRVLRNVIHY